MNSPREPATLRELQARFAAALRAPNAGAEACESFLRDVLDDDLPAAARLRVYRNNTRLIFAEALRLTYPVVRRRVGDEFFERLAHEYREMHPSRRGDLHWVGEPFAGWLASRLSQSGYEWLADLARLEWACEQALVAAEIPAAQLADLGRIPHDRLADAAITFVASTAFVSSPYPVWSVWQENQPGAAGGSTDLARGAEHVIVAASSEGLVLLSVPEDELHFASELAAGRTLGAALERSGLPIERLPVALRQLFDSGLIGSVRAAEPGAAT